MFCSDFSSSSTRIGHPPPTKGKKIQVLIHVLNNKDSFILFNKHDFANLFKKKNAISDY